MIPLVSSPRQKLLEKQLPPMSAASIDCNLIHLQSAVFFLVLHRNIRQFLSDVRPLVSHHIKQMHFSLTLLPLLPHTKVTILVLHSLFKTPSLLPLLLTGRAPQCPLTHTLINPLPLACRSSILSASCHHIPGYSGALMHPRNHTLG